METGTSWLLSTDADAPALERVLEIEFVAFVPTEHPLAAAPRCRYASQRERGNREPCG
jgi:hypothetical protein